MSLPVLGAALPVAELGRHRDWLFERDRDLELQDFLMPEVLMGDWRGLVAVAKRKLDGWKGRLDIHGPFKDFDVDASDPEVRAFVRKRLGQGLDAAEALGADLMVIHSPFSTWASHNDFLGWKGPHERLERAVETLRPVAERARAAGITLAIENIEDKSAEDRLRLAEALGPAAAVSLDTGHAHYAHVSTGGRPVDWHVLGAGGRLAHVHVQDADGHADRHWPPGMGTVPWAPVFAALAAKAPGARLILELKNPDQIRAGAAYLAVLGLAE